MADLITDQRIAEFSKRIGRDIKDDRVRITSNEINISKLNETTDIHNKRLDNLTAAAQGKNFTFQTDADTEYSKLVPAGAMPYAGVKSYGGRTLVWNQLVRNLGSPFSEGTGGSIVNATMNENKCSATALLGSFYRWYIGLNISNSLKILNHKYYISSFIKSTSDIKPQKIRLAINHTNGFKDVPFTKNGKYSAIVECLGTGVSLVSGWYDNTYIGNEVSFEVSNTMIFDLTLMFGAGNEPATVEEFEAMFPADYYEYNAGELLSAGVSEVQSVKEDGMELASLAIPSAVQNLPGYGWSAGTAKNWVDWEKKIYHREVEKYDFTGNEVVYKDNPETNFTFYLVQSGVKNRYGDWSCKGIMNKFLKSIAAFQTAFQWNWTNANSNLVSLTFPTTFTTTDSVKEWLKSNQTTIYYELATPELIDISDILPADNLIETEAGGTLTFKNQHGDDYRISVPSEVEYMINVEEAL